jgi:hypothetical protein
MKKMRICILSVYGGDMRALIKTNETHSIADTADMGGQGRIVAAAREFFTSRLEHWLRASFNHLNQGRRLQTDSVYRSTCYRLITDQAWSHVATELQFGYYIGSADGKLQRVLPEN